MVREGHDYYAILYQCQAYCIEHGLEKIGRDEDWLDQVSCGEVAEVMASDGSEIELLHPDSIQFESFPSDFFPQGLYCAVCESELIAPLEEGVLNDEC